MTALLAGWLLAALAAASCALTGRRLARTRRAVARAEHELRGPLSAISLAVNLGVRQDGLHGRGLRAIGAETHRVERALDDLARARHGGKPVIAFADVDLCEVVGDSVEAWRPVAVARGVSLELSCDVGCAAVLGDPTRLAQATGNLIANAIEHGGSQVRVRAGTGQAGVLLEVTDNGPGLPIGVLPVDARSSPPRRPPSRRRGRSRGRVGGGGRGRDGRGQGLAIVADIASAHGGRLSAVADGGRAGETSPPLSTNGDAPRVGASLVIELPGAPRA